MVRAEALHSAIIVNVLDLEVLIFTLVRVKEVILAVKDIIKTEPELKFNVATPALKVIGIIFSETPDK